MRRMLLLLLLASCSTRAHGVLAPADPALEGFDPARLERVTELVRGSIERGEHAGVSLLVARHGRVVLEQSFGLADLQTRAPMRPDTIVRIYSMSKVITAVAALQLFEDGVLRLDEPITRWLPELAGLQVATGGTADSPALAPLARPITVRMLLNHTAGFTYDFFSGSPAAELYKRAELWEASSLEEFLERVAKLPLVRQPGEGFDYGISDDVLGVLIERASGLSFEDFVARRITEPLGMHDTFFDVPEEKRARVAGLCMRSAGTLAPAPLFLEVHAEPGRGFASGGAGLFSTLRDYARFGQCLLDGGTLDGVRILGRKTVELARTNSLPPGANAFDPTQGWGLFSAVQLALPMHEPGSVGAFGWGGAATTYFLVDPSEDLIMLVFAQHLPYDETQLFPRFRTAVYQALE